MTVGRPTVIEGPSRDIRAVSCLLQPAFFSGTAVASSRKSLLPTYARVRRSFRFVPLYYSPVSPSDSACLVTFIFFSSHPTLRPNEKLVPGRRRLSAIYVSVYIYIHCHSSTRHSPVHRRLEPVLAFPVLTLPNGGPRELSERIVQPRRTGILPLVRRRISRQIVRCHQPIDPRSPESRSRVISFECQQRAVTVGT